MSSTDPLTISVLSAHPADSLPSQSLPDSVTLLTHPTLYDALTTPVVPDYLLLLTPETVLGPTAIAQLLSCSDRVARHDPTPAVIVGATQCPETGDVATGILNRVSPRSRIFRRVPPGLACLPGDTFDPTGALLPRPVLAALRNLPHVPRAVTHNLGLRVRRLGFGIFLAPSFVGTSPKMIPGPRNSRRHPDTHISAGL